jgi:hypothetical protein
MSRLPLLSALCLFLSLTLLAGCGGHSATISPAPLSADNLNLVFVISPDLAYQAPGDVDAATANLTSQGLQRALMMASYLNQRVLAGNNVTNISVLEPMTHLQTANKYPDMAAIGSIQQFALLNRYTRPIDAAGTTYTANSFPLGAAYAPGSVPDGVAVPAHYAPDGSGIDFNNTGGNNDALAAGIITKNTPGYYVFTAPWETISAMLAKINASYGYNLAIPTTYPGPNYVYAITIPASGSASLVTYDSKLAPPASFPALPAPLARAVGSHTLQPFFSTVRTGGVSGAVVPANSNKNSKIYIIRHAEAHPDAGYHFENGNFVGAGQWRALDLPNALRGKISPNVVYSIDPSQWFPTGTGNFSYVRPSLTVLPYVVANNLPYRLVSTFQLGDVNVPQLASDFFFTGGTFSNQIVLLAWESSRIKPLINALLASYGGNSLPLLPAAWPGGDYDTIWTVTIDAQGNLTVDNELFEDIESSLLPVGAPLY